jgi:hypothetical protein
MTIQVSFLLNKCRQGIRRGFIGIHQMNGSSSPRGSSPFVFFGVALKILSNGLTGRSAPLRSRPAYLSCSMQGSCYLNLTPHSVNNAKIDKGTATMLSGFPDKFG